MNVFDDDREFNFREWRDRAISHIRKFSFSAKTLCGTNTRGIRERVRKVSLVKFMIASQCLRSWAFWLMIVSVFFHFRESSMRASMGEETMMERNWGFLKLWNSLAETRRSELVLNFSLLIFYRRLIEVTSTNLRESADVCFYIWLNTSTPAAIIAAANNPARPHEIRSGILIVELRFVCCLWVYSSLDFLIISFVFFPRRILGKKKLPFSWNSHKKIQLEKKISKRNKIKIWRKNDKFNWLLTDSNRSKLLNLAWKFEAWSFRISITTR